MLRVLAFSAVACVMTGVGQLRRAGTAPLTPPEIRYDFNEVDGVGIICPALTNNIQQKTPGYVAKEIIFIESPEVGPESEEALKFPLKALMDGIIFVRGKAFMRCSDITSLTELPDFDINNLVVNETGEIVGYFEKSPADVLV